MNYMYSLGLVVFAYMLIPLARKHILPYLYVQSCSWGWTLGFETCL